MENLQLFNIQVSNAVSGARRSVMRMAATAAHAEQMVLCGPTDVVTVKVLGAVDTFIATLTMGRKPSLRVMKDFYQRLGQCLRIDPSLVRALTSMLPQLTHPGMAAAVSSALAAFSLGDDPNKALESFRGILPDDHLVMLRNASLAGQVPEVVEEIRHNLERSYTSFRKLRNATIYPIIVITLAMGVLMWVTTKQFPAIAQIYSAFNTPLPAITRAAMMFSNFLLAYPVTMPLFLAAPAYLFYIFPQIYKKQQVQDIVDAVPSIRRLLFKLNMAKSLRSLSMLNHAGVHLQECLGMVADITPHHRMRRFWLGLRADIVDNARDPFVAAMLHQDDLGVDGLEFVALLKLAGENGDFAQVMGMLAKNYEDDASDAINNIETIMQPLTLVVVGAVVGLVAVAVLMPIANMTTLFSTSSSTGGLH